MKLILTVIIFSYCKKELNVYIRKTKLAKRKINFEDTKKFYFIYARMSEGLNVVLKILVRKNKKIPYSGTSIS